MKILRWWSNDNNTVVHYHDLKNISNNETFLYLAGYVGDDGQVICRCMISLNTVASLNPKDFKNLAALVDDIHDITIDEAKIKAQKIAEMYGFKVLDQTLEVYT
jgi:hypothetical protein